MSDAQEFCPYRGLQPFTKEDAEYFFGRLQDREKIISNLRVAPLTILYGASGVGKTSVLQAGVMAELAKTTRTAVVFFRTWQKPDVLSALKEEVFQALPNNISDPKNAIDPALPLDEFLAASSRRVRRDVLILFDQFEEYFLYVPAVQTDDGFEAQFARAVNRDDVRANFLISMREDSLSKLDRFKGRIRNILGNTLRMSHLDQAAAEESIRGPLRIYNKNFPSQLGEVTIEDDAVRAILNQLRTAKAHSSESAGAGRVENAVPEDRIETPFLQLVLTELWNAEKKQDSRILRRGTFEDEAKLGGATAIVSRYVNTALNISPDEQEACARVFRFLVTPDQTKIALPVSVLANWSELPADRISTVMTKLASGENRILRSVEPSPGQRSEQRYELFHDVLAPAILDWRKCYVQEQEVLKARQQAADEAAERERLAAEKRRTELRRRRNTLVTVSAIVLLTILSASGLLVGAFSQKARRADEQLAKRVLQDNELFKKSEKAASIRQEGYRQLHQRKYEDALKSFNSALQSYQDLNNREDQVSTLVDIGDVLALTGKFSDAEAAYKQAQLIPKQKEEKGSDGRLLESLASLNEREGRLPAALDFYVQANEAYQGAGDYQASGRVLEKLGYEAEKSRTLPHAVVLYQDALKSYNFAGDQLGKDRVQQALRRLGYWGFLVDLLDGKTYELKPDQVNIGRDVEGVKNDISFSNRLVSRRHLTINRDLHLDDLRSRNGTTINARLLPYGIGAKLSDKDIIVLADVEPLQFRLEKPSAPLQIPRNAWAILIDDQSKSYRYMTNEEYFLAIVDGKLLLQVGSSESAVLKLRRGQDTPQMFYSSSEWKLAYTLKETDYEYKTYIVKSGKWEELYDIPLTFVKLSQDDKNILVNGPSFQIVFFKQPAS
jgi:tetratricopeptide (TPR) repeat protein